MEEKTNASHYLLLLLVRYKYHFFSVVTLACLTAILNTSFGAMLKWLTDGLQKGSSSVLFPFISLFALQRFLLPITGASGALISNRLANKIESDIRKSWYEYVVGLDYGSSKLKNSGEYQKKMQEAVASVRTLLNNTLRSLLSITLDVISITLFAIFFIGAKAGLLLLFFAIFYSAFVIKSTRKRMPVMKEIAQSDAECAAFMHDSFINSGVISPDVRKNRVNQHEILLSKLEGRKNFNSRKLFFDSSFSAVICLSASFFLLTAYYQEGSTSIGVIIMLATSLAQLIVQINTLGFNYRSILSARIDIMRISDGLKIKEKSNSGAAPPIFGAKNYIFSFQEFMASDVSADNTPSIHGSISLNYGMINTLRGTSGIGKSTAARAMRGELRASARQLLINGMDSSGIQADILLEKIGYVSQDNTIFNESIIKNLRYGKSNATQNEIVESLSKVGLGKFSNSLEFVVGEKGGLLSGGERQRLVIARGLLQDCEILILDEPFSGLDEEMAYELAGTIVSLACEMCIFVIMHQRPEPLFGHNSKINQHTMEEKGGRVYISNLEEKF
ncbi:ATP-binding cassette domain-containing protein [Cupriavidus basilensis]|uniref:ABC transporter ATP-binding protein n=1 Tax=Cupriavidus basilensis TaxID=68895 RepID=A0A7M2H872_9BURK|nr:ABC transporter ATP-binding protein [Cupriavidus basilensis]QOT81058.1 ABC transporter ATP-binding protein [Cupriavidus basilensis]